MMAAILRRPWILLAVLLGYLGGVFALSHLSGATMSWIGLDIWDKAAHFLQYCPIGFLVAGYLVLRRGAPRGRLVVLLSTMVISAAFGALDEIHQHFVPGRMSSVLDVAADVLGAGAGGVAGLRVFLGGRPSSSPS